MITQDKAEADNIGATNYRKKISKYKLMVTKLNEDDIEALKHCASSDFKLIENVPEVKQVLLNDNEKTYITRWTSLG